MKKRNAPKRYRWFFIADLLINLLIERGAIHMPLG
jgi:hypothetical protein